MAQIRTGLIDRLLQQVWDRGGTDLLLTAGSPPLLRVDGALHQADWGKSLDAESLENLMRELLPENMYATLKEERELDFSFSWQELARFRGSAFHQRDSVALQLRLIPNEIPTFQQLGLPKVVEDLVTKPSGLILVTGPTGSGKSTSLASMLDYINQRRAVHILTVEDPIEYVHAHKMGAVTQREVGDDTKSFERALRSALREDPDVLLIGEMRDLRSIATALTIAETGHLVFATLHTNDTAQALDRIVDVFPAERHPQIRTQLAASLTAVIYQRLLPMAGGGMIAAFEVLVANHAVRNLVREGKTRQLRNMVATHQLEGMQTLEQDLSRLVADGAIEYEVAVAASLFPKEIERLAGHPGLTGSVSMAAPLPVDAAGGDGLSVADVVVDDTDGAVMAGAASSPAYNPENRKNGNSGGFFRRR